MLKVLAMIDSYRVSGPCRGLLQLVEGTRSSGVQFIIGVFLTRSQSTSPMIEEFGRQGLKLAIWSQRRRYDLSLIQMAWKTARKDKVTVLQSHGYKPAVVAWCLKHVLGLPWIAVVHGHTSENKRIALYNKLDLWVTRSADRVVAVSEATGRFLEQNGILNNRIRVIPNAIDSTAHQTWKTGEELRQRCGAGPDHLLVGVIGRLSPEKGCAIFLRAVEQVVATIPAARAVFVGEGQEAEHLQAIAHERGLDECVSFVGYQTDTSSVYAALDLVVIPSISEGLPNVLLEAYLHRKAVVATAVGGIPDVMRSVSSQWLVPPGNVRALADAIISALQDSKVRAEVAEAGSRFIREGFTCEHRVVQFLNVYQELIAPHLWRNSTVEPQQAPPNHNTSGSSC